MTNSVLGVDGQAYRLHVEEFNRFRSYFCIEAHIWPTLPLQTRPVITGLSEKPIVLRRTDEAGKTVLRAELLIDPWPELEEISIVIEIVRRRDALPYPHKRLDFVRFNSIGEDYREPDPFDKLNDRFSDYVAANPRLRVLEIGSRKRAATRNVARASKFKAVSKYVGMDILPGDNVDVVGDAHKLSEYFAPDSFDCVYSDYVFEHLLSPLKVVLEVNKVLSPGGLVFINTNQSIGLHDEPWDFHRFSKWAWIAYFNQQTGFEIVDSAMGRKVRLTPVLYDRTFESHEGGAGCQGSAVWARRTGASTLDLDIDVPALLKTLPRQYPVEITD